MDTKDKGDIGELAAAKKLKDNGHTVLFPFGDNASYDMVYDQNGDLIKSQVKHGYYENGAVKVDLRKNHRKDGMHVHEEYKEDELDVYMIYCGELDEVYEVPFNEAAKTSINIRVEEPNHDNGRIKWAKNYRL